MNGRAYPPTLLDQSGGIGSDGVMETLSSFTQHLRSRNLSAQTIRLRLSHARELACLVEPTTERLETWVHPPDRRLAPETIKSRRASARAFFSWLHATGRRSSDPSFALQRVVVPERLPRVIPDRDVWKALAGAPVRVRAAILLARYGCLRLTEIATLATAQRFGDHLRIRGKGGKERMIYLHDSLIAVLDLLEQQQGEGYYFPGRYEAHMHPQSLHKVIKRATGWNPHALRHAGATAAYIATKDLRAVQMFLGHSSIRTTQRYLHLDDGALRAVAAGVQLKLAA